MPDKTDMEALEYAGEKAKEWNAMGKDFKSFIKRWNGLIGDARTKVGKKLNTATDEDIIAYLGGQPLTDGQLAAMRKNFQVGQDMIDIVKGIHDKLPATNITEA